MTRIGVISDSHGVVHLAVFTLFRNVAAIVHAGDVGADSVLSDLATLAPVHAVRGNVDVGATPSLERLPDELVVEFERVRLFVTHVGGTDDEVRARFGERLRLERARLFVCGHSHRAMLHDAGDWIVLNPGGSGRRRFSLPLTAAVLVVEGEDARARIVDLDDGRAIEGAWEGL